MNNITKAGFIAIVGRPNVGKSTLLNKLIGENVAIVSQKPQTTRTKITAILNKKDTQMVFLDTPGFHRPQTRLGQYMVKVINESIADVDCVLMVVEPRLNISAGDIEIIEKIKSKAIPAVLVINKIDTIKSETLLPIISEYSKLYDFSSIVPVSALNDKGMDIVIDEIIKLMPDGPAFFPEEMLTDQPEKQIVGEIIREKMLRLLDEEVPHGIAVEIIRMKERDEGKLLDISANIFCEKESHKGIIIGKKGLMLKKIGSLARQDIEEFFQTKVYLELWVKVKDDWRNDNYSLKEFGFNK